MTDGWTPRGWRDTGERHTGDQGRTFGQLVETGTHEYHERWAPLPPTAPEVAALFDEVNGR